jgi:hypothetical protein
VVKQKTVEFWNTMAGTNGVGLVDDNSTKNSSPAAIKSFTGASVTD